MRLARSTSWRSVLMVPCSQVVLSRSTSSICALGAVVPADTRHVARREPRSPRLQPWGVSLRDLQVGEDRFSLVADEETRFAAGERGIVGLAHLGAVNEEVEVATLGDDLHRVGGIQATVDHRVGSWINQALEGAATHLAELPLPVPTNSDLILVPPARP